MSVVWRSSESLPKAQKIRVRAEYLAVQGCGRKLVTRHLLVFVRERARQVDGGSVAKGDAARLGVTVTRKVGNAVARNRLKRRLRDLFRRHKSWFPARRDIVIVAKPQAAAASYTALRSELEDLCGRHFGRS